MRTSCPVVLIVLLLVGAAIAAVVLLLGQDDDEPSTATTVADPSTSEATSQTTETSSEPTTEETSEDTSVVVDEADYIGRDVAEVERELQLLGLDVRLIEDANPGGETEGEVLSVNPSGDGGGGDAVDVHYWGARTTRDHPDHRDDAADRDDQHRD